MTKAMRIVCMCMALAILAAPLAAGEGKWVPQRAVTIIVPNAAGGGNDVMARIMLPHISKYLGGATVVVENLVGAGGSVAFESVRAAPADGYSILCHNNGIGSVATTGNTDVTYKDFDMLCLLAAGNPTFQVPGTSPINTMGELIEMLKTRETTVCHSGIGGMPFMPELALLSLIPDGLARVNFVPYDSGRECANALATGEVDWGISDVIEGQGNWPDKLAKPLAIFKTEATEVPGFGILPPITDFIEVPRELMVTGSNYRAFSIKAGTPENIKKELEAAILYAFNSADFQNFMKNNALTPSGLIGREAQDMFIEMARRQSWMLYDFGFADESPAFYGIDRP